MNVHLRKWREKKQPANWESIERPKQQRVDVGVGGWMWRPLADREHTQNIYTAPVPAGESSHH